LYLNIIHPPKKERMKNKIFFGCVSEKIERNNKKKIVKENISKMYYIDLKKTKSCTYFPQEQQKKKV
jgi:hypothetical protein